jgi:phage terminase large subunit GpA-like protein
VVLAVAMSLSLAEVFAEAFAPLPEISVSHWADTFRQVPKPSPSHGEWRTELVPYMREPMDRMSPDDPTQIVALMKGAQGAGTEGMLNVLACYMHLYPRDAMLLLPTIKMAQGFGRKRVDRMFEATPVLRNLVVEPRSREATNTTVLKQFGPGRDSLKLAGANSWADLQSDPIPLLLCDEVDSYKRDIPGFGNPLDSAIQRTAGFADRKIWLASTPTSQNANISVWFRAGDQNEYFVPCPLCGHKQVLVWGADRYKRKEFGGIRWPSGHPEQAAYECEKCAATWPEWRKVEVVGAGEWRPQAPGNGAHIGIRSYHVGCLVYPHGWPGSKWTNLAFEWERDHEDKQKRQMFANLKEGLPWRDPAESIADARVLFSRREKYGPEIPADVAVLTLTADVQGNRIEAEVLGWGPREECWSIDYRVLAGDPATENGAVWQALDALLGSQWLSETGLTLGIRAACVDASYQQDIVRRWCYARRLRNVWAVIGRDGQDRPSWPTKLPKAKPGRPHPATVIGVDGLKETVYARLRIIEPGPGYCHFPEELNLEHFEMLTAEERVADYSRPVPAFVWRKKKAGSRNEFLDIRAYQHAALKGLEYHTGFRLDAEVEKHRKLVAALTQPPSSPVAVAEPSRADWLGGRGRNWKF